MKKIVTLLFTFILFASNSFASDNSAKELAQDSWIRINQAGYLPQDIKVAVFISLSQNAVCDFSVFEAATDKQILTGKGARAGASQWGMQSAFRFNFSTIEKEGGYYIVSNGVKSPVFKISANAYDGLADFLLEYMRQQRCGDNPYTGELCHQHDGFIVDHPTRTGERVDVRGGWHDATDYLQYQTTSATAVYHMMFAWEQSKDKSVFKDNFNASGRQGANGIPDILDEIRWGLEWLVRMNPEDKVMFNQIADDRDHAGFRLPQNDTVNYGWGPGKGRPVYFVTGNPQGLGKYINRTTGVASTAGKFSSSFALGAQIFKELDPEFAAVMREKSLQAYEFAVEKPGNTQTACIASPYFYEEDTYVDDIELAAATVYHYGKETEWRKRADYWGQLEPVSPWMELGRGRHYQYYPFLNLGHYYLAISSDGPTKAKYLGYMKDALEHLKKRAGDDPFIYGIPFLWCSNNLVSAAITHAHLYREVSGDDTYLEMEVALRDWLFGTNPWGTSMLVGFPEGGDFPMHPHSSYTVLNGDITYGGLVDGPIERELFLERAGKSLTKLDEYTLFNNGKAVYHDDIGDYASNEPTMDGTAGLSYYFSAMEVLGKSNKEKKVIKDCWGAVTRNNVQEKVIYLLFSADSMFEGGTKILNTLSNNNIKGSFFFTGNYLRMSEYSKITKRIIKEGHYVGAHSNKHILYAPWDKREKTLPTPDSLFNDLKSNYIELSKYGISVTDAPWFLPPYEWYNRESVYVASLFGLQTLNYTPGTATPADYTTPDMRNYKTSAQLIEALFNFEKKEGLNGAFILIHPGTESSRIDKLYDSLGFIIEKLKIMGYRFERL